MPILKSLLRLPTKSSNPTGVAAGDCYYSTSTNTVWTYNGTSWVDMSPATLTGRTISGASNTLSAIATTSLADFIAPPGVTLNTWTTLTLTNSWVVSTALADSPSTAAYWVSPTGWVAFRGLIKSGTANAAAFTMPAGLRSSFSRIFICHANSGTDTQARVIFGSDGTMKPTLTWTNQLALDSINYQVG